MKGVICQETVKAVERACIMYLNAEMTSGELQDVLCRAEHEVVAYEERWLRALLCEVENRIEEITFTESNEYHRASITLVVRDLLDSLRGRSN